MMIDQGCGLLRNLGNQASPQAMSESSPVASTSPGKPVNRPIPFHGMVSAVDQKNKTFTINGKGATRGSCLVERRLGEADITVRFPSDWITNWRQVADAIDRLVAQMRPVRG